MSETQPVDTLIEQLVADRDWASIIRLDCVLGFHCDACGDALVRCIEESTSATPFERLELQNLVLDFRRKGGMFFSEEDPPGEWNTDEILTFELMRLFRRAVSYDKEAADEMFHPH